MKAGMKSVIICVLVSVLTLGIAALAALFFGTVKFLRVLSKLEDKLITLNQKLIQEVKKFEELKALNDQQIDLANSRKSMPCKRCSYTEI